MKIMKAVQYVLRMNKEGSLLARKELEEAINLDPEYSVLYSMLAATHVQDLLYQTGESPEISFAQASKNINQAKNSEKVERWVDELPFIPFVYTIREIY